MGELDLLQEYKELYNHEIAFSDRLNAKISNALAILTIIGTGEVIVWKDCLGEGFNIVLFILCILSIQSFIFCSAITYNRIIQNLRKFYMKLFHLLTVVQFGTKLTVFYNHIERIITYNSPKDIALSDIIECDVKNVSVVDGRLYVEIE